MITAIRPGAPRFQQPDEVRFKPCEGDLAYTANVDLPQIGLVDAPFTVVVDWKRDEEGEIDWRIRPALLAGDLGKVLLETEHHITLEALFYRALRKAILAEHSARIEERCAEEAERDG